ncbi:MAG: HK97 family phage prohead protease [Caldilineaceae bacterium]
MGRDLRFLVEDYAAEPATYGSTPLRGYAAVFNSFSVDMGDWREVIRPGAFAWTLSRKPDVRVTVDHAGGFTMLGRTTNGTLKLSEDAHGLRVEITPANTTVGRDIAELVRRGDLTQMSFAFFTRRDNWLKTENGLVRELIEADLDGGDVAVVTYPAYPATSIGVRTAPDYGVMRRRLQLMEMESELWPQQWQSGKSD